jgi:hypothetical protein
MEEIYSQIQNFNEFKENKYTKAAHNKTTENQR